MWIDTGDGLSRTDGEATYLLDGYGDDASLWVYVDDIEMELDCSLNGGAAAADRFIATLPTPNPFGLSGQLELDWQRAGTQVWRADLGDRIVSARWAGYWSGRPLGGHAHLMHGDRRLEFGIWCASGTWGRYGVADHPEAWSWPCVGDFLRHVEGWLQSDARVRVTSEGYAATRGGVEVSVRIDSDSAVVSADTESVWPLRDRDIADIMDRHLAASMMDEWETRDGLRTGGLHEPPDDLHHLVNRVRPDREVVIDYRSRIWYLRDGRGRTLYREVYASVPDLVSALAALKGRPLPSREFDGL